LDPSLFTPKTLRSLRSESDLYGYSTWLAKYLRYPVVPLSMRGFQHGWVWWKKSNEEPIELGLDPNLNKYLGTLVQDLNVHQVLQNKKIFSVIAGLPFLNFRSFCGYAGKFSERIEGSVLYVPTHSNPWNNYSFVIGEMSDRALKVIGRDCAVLLSWNDRQLAPVFSERFSTVEIGAGALEISSFYRLSRIFEKYEFVITDSMGSHVLYAASCGAKVGIHRALYRPLHDKNSLRSSTDYEFLKKIGGQEWMDRYSEIDFIDSTYPGLVTEGFPIGGFTPPQITEMSPECVATYLGWELTLESELASRGFFPTGI